MRSRSSSKSTIIAVDPGGTTGWTVISIDREALITPDMSILQSVTHFTFGQITGDEVDQAAELVDLSCHWPGAPIVIESFEIRQMAVELSPVKINYAMRMGLRCTYECLDTTPPRVFEQTASLAKTTASDERLQRWGYHAMTAGYPHARDATRHALTFLRRAKASHHVAYNAWPGLKRFANMQ